MIPIDHLELLSIEEATQGLDSWRKAELELLLNEGGAEAQEIHERIHLAAAAVDLAHCPHQSLPQLPASLERQLEGLSRRIEEVGLNKVLDAHAEASPQSSNEGNVAPIHGRDNPSVSPVKASAAESNAANTSAQRPDANPRPGAGWLLAAAAALLALLGWWPRLGQSPQPLPDEPTSVSTNGTVGSQPVLDGLTAWREAEDLLTLAFSATEDEASALASGEVLWSQQLQQGVMRIKGLTSNDPSQSQYQLWIFDERRDQRYPVDGGVFDVPAGQTQVEIPIHAKVSVGTPTLFAITVEEPGGVVVSERERIVLVAQPS